MNSMIFQRGRYTTNQLYVFPYFPIKTSIESGLVETTHQRVDIPPVFFWCLTMVHGRYQQMYRDLLANGARRVVVPRYVQGPAGTYLAEAAVEPWWKLMEILQLTNMNQRKTIGKP